MAKTLKSRKIRRTRKVKGRKHRKHATRRRMKKGGANTPELEVIYDFVYNVNNPKCIEIKKDETKLNELITILQNLYKEGEDDNNQKIFRYIEFLNIKEPEKMHEFMNTGKINELLSDEEKKLITYPDETIYTENIKKLEKYSKENEC